MSVERDPRFSSDQNNLIQIKSYLKRKQQVTIVPRSLAQEQYVELLKNPKKFIVFAIGPAGTGKTMLGVQMAIKQLKEGAISKIIVTRPAVSVDEDHGFLPGTLIQKMEPWTRPIFDVFEEYYHPKEIQAMLEDGVIDCIVNLPTKLFLNTQIPACLFFLARNRTNNGKFRNRKNEILFIDARKSGALVSRKNKAFTDEDITKISEVYHNWRSKDGNYEDIQGFCKSATLKEVEDNNFVLTPGRYVGTEDIEDDGISFEDKIAVISENLKSHFEQSILLQERIKENLKKVGIEL
jgi:hypothetical protein